MHGEYYPGIFLEWKSAPEFDNMSSRMHSDHSRGEKQLLSPFVVSAQERAAIPWVFLLQWLRIKCII